MRLASLSGLGMTALDTPVALSAPGSPIGGGIPGTIQTAMPARFSTPRQGRKPGGCGCGCGGSRRGKCCPQNQASNANRSPISLNINLTPVQNVNSGTQSSYENSTRSIVGPDGRPVTLPGGGSQGVTPIPSPVPVPMPQTMNVSPPYSNGALAPPPAAPPTQPASANTSAGSAPAATPTVQFAEFT